MTYAIIQLQGKQYLVSRGDELLVDRLDTKSGETFEINDVLLVKDEKKLTIGQPLVKGVKVSAKILDHSRSKKLRVATYKAKSRYRRVKGHRQLQSTLQITDIASQ